MYQQYYGFTRAPFRLESEPDMFFFGDTQSTVLENIKASLSAGKGITTLSGLPGTGKTTIMRRAMEESVAPHIVVCRIDRGQCSGFIETLKKEILIRQPAYSEDNLALIDLGPLVDKVVTGGNKEYLIVIDEAHKLLIPELDELLRLANLETNARRRFKFLLISHRPLEYFEFSKEQNHQDLFSAHCALEPLSSTEIFPYVYHRLEKAGWKNTPEFSSNIQQLVFKVTQGIPRRINSFFDRLMLFAFFESQKKIDLSFVKLFCRDLSEELNHISNPDLDSFALWQGLKSEASLFAESNNRNKTWFFSIVFGLIVAGGLAYIYIDTASEPSFFPIDKVIDEESQTLFKDMEPPLPLNKTHSALGMVSDTIEKTKITESIELDFSEEITPSPEKSIVVVIPRVPEKTPEIVRESEPVVIAEPVTPMIIEKNITSLKAKDTTVKQILTPELTTFTPPTDNDDMPFILEEEAPTAPVVIKEPIQVVIAKQIDSDLPVPVPFFTLTQAPRFLHREKPVYPEAMIGNGSTGVVKLEALIDSKGEVRDVIIIKSAGKHFDKAAQQAAYASRFLPAKVAQETVAVRLKFPVRFGTQ